jgi:hypothetical protein
VGVLDTGADLVNELDAVIVLDCGPDLDKVGEPDDVLELVVVDVDVFVKRVVLD